MKCPRISRSGLGWTLLLFLAGLGVSGPDIACGADPDKSEAYQGVWQQVAQLLEVREYASALELITEAESESGLAAFRDRLQTDRKDIEALQHLASLVKEQAAKLKAGESLKVGATEYKVVKFISDAQGDRLVLKSATSSTESEKALASLDPKAWIALAQPRLTTSAEDRYILGMFQASVEHGDRKAARQALNLAAADGAMVTHWTARIDAEALAQEDEQLAKKAQAFDRILGTWRMVIGEGKGEKRVNITFLPRGKTDLRTSTWRKSGDNEYVLSSVKGATARLSMGPKGEGLKGTMANGTKVFLQRQAKAKR